MTFDEICKRAAAGESMADGSELIDCGCYERIQNLLNDFAGHRISQEEATKKKNDIRRNFELEQSEKYARRAAYAQYQESIRRASESWTTLPKAVRDGLSGNDLILRLLDIISAMTGDSVTAGIVAKQLE